MAVSTVFSKIRETPSEFEVIKLLDDKQLTTATSDEVDINNAKYICMYGHGNGPAVNGGVVTLEGSPVSGHTGTWKSLGTITIANTAMVAAAVTDGDDGFPVRFVRARISTKIANGNCDVYLVVQK